MARSAGTSRKLRRPIRASKLHRNSTNTPRSAAPSVMRWQRTRTASSSTSTLAMIERYSPGSQRRLTVSSENRFHMRDFVAAFSELCVTPYFAARVHHLAIDR